MHYIPKIVFIANPKKDAQLFWGFLTHTYYLDKRRHILATFPELGTRAHKKDFRNIVKKFVLDYYKKHKEEIKKIVKSNGGLIRRDGAKSFRLLSRLMDYQWKRPITYHAYTTILPFSPFGNQLFYYSIIRKLEHPDWKVASVLYVGIHEISHMIFFKLLKEIERKHKITLHKDTQYFLKEALTTALLNRRESMLALKKAKKEPGNPEIRELYVTDEDGTPQKLIDLIRKRYARCRRKKMLFQSFLEYLVLLTRAAEKSFNVKRKMRDTYGKKILKYERLLNQYKKPIKLRQVPTICTK